GEFGRTDASRAPDRLVAGEAGAANHRAPEDDHAAAQSLTAEEIAGHAGAEGLVADEGGVGDDQRAVSADGAAVGARISIVAAGCPGPLVVLEGAIGDGEPAVGVDRAPFRRSVARPEALEFHERVCRAGHRPDGLIADERRAADGGGAAAGGAGLIPEGAA